MKKVGFLSLILFCTVFCYSKDYSAKVFKDCFDETYKSYEFNIRNPLFADTFYVEDLSSLKNKIIKQTYEIYDIDEQGRKSYSDSYIRTVSYCYYFFDSDGQITDYYYIDLNDKGDIFYKKHEQHNCLESLYEIFEENYFYESKKNILGSIYKKDGSITINFDSYYNNWSQIEFHKNKILKIKNNGKNLSYIDEYIINDTKIQNKDYYIDNEEISYEGESEYENAALMGYKYFRPYGNEVYKYEMETPQHGFFTYYNEKNPSNKIIKQEVNRRFNTIGFLEYEERKPYKTSVGDYYYYSATVLSNKDDFFIQYFGK